MRALIYLLTAHVTTALECAGALAIGYGLWLLAPPAAWMWAGVACFGLDYALEARRRQEPPA